MPPSGPGLDGEDQGAERVDKTQCEDGAEHTDIAECTVYDDLDQANRIWRVS